mgnify:CR=1 FL=1
MFKKKLPILYSKFLHEVGNYFLDAQYNSHSPVTSFLPIFPYCLPSHFSCIFPDYILKKYIFIPSEFWPGMLDTRLDLTKLGNCASSKFTPVMVLDGSSLSDARTRVEIRLPQGYCLH